MRLPLSCERRETRATISCLVAALCVTGLPVSRASARLGKSSRESMDSHSSIALSARNNPRSDANGAAPSLWLRDGYRTRRSRLPPRCKRARLGSGASVSTSDHSARQLPSRFRASRASRPEVEASAPPSERTPHRARLSSRSDGVAAAMARALAHPHPLPLSDSTRRLANGALFSPASHTARGTDDTTRALPQSRRTWFRLSSARLGNSSPKRATAGQSRIRLPLRSISRTRVATTPHAAASPGAPAVATAASGRYTRSSAASAATGSSFFKHSSISIFCPFELCTYASPSPASASASASAPRVFGTFAISPLPSRYLARIAAAKVTLGRILCARTNEAGRAPGSRPVAAHSKYRLPSCDPSCFPRAGSSHSTPTHSPSCPSTEPT